jgi:hypothetical protein
MAKKKTKLQNYTWLIIAAIVVVAIIVLTSGEGGTLAKFAQPAMKIQPVPAPTGQPDLVPELKLEYTPAIGKYSAFIIVRNAGTGTVTTPFTSEVAQQDPSTRNNQFIGSCKGPDGSANTVVRTAAGKVRFNPTTLGPNEELECAGYGLQFSLNDRISIYTDTSNAVAESNENNNELKVGRLA